MTGQSGPGHAADDTGDDDLLLPFRLCTTLIRCHGRNLPARLTLPCRGLAGQFHSQAEAAGQQAGALARPGR